MQYPRPAQIAPDEWAAWVHLAACCRSFDLLGWAELIYNHVTLRVPGQAGHFRPNRFGLIKVDLRGNIVGHSPRPIRQALGGDILAGRAGQQAPIATRRRDAQAVGAAPGRPPA